MTVEPSLLAWSVHREPVALRPVEPFGKRFRRDRQIRYFSVAGCLCPVSSGSPSVFSCPDPALFQGPARRGESGFPVAAGKSGGVAYRVFGLVVDEQSFHLFDRSEPVVSRVCPGLVCGPAG